MKLIRVNWNIQHASAALALILALLFTSAPCAAWTQKFTLKQVLDLPLPSELTAATHGDRIAWVFQRRGAWNVWVADGRGLGARQLTSYAGEDGMPITSLRMTPDGATLVYARGSEIGPTGDVANPASNVRRPEQQVWAVDVAGGTPRLLGAMNCSSVGCEDVQISPDGKHVVWSGQGKLWLAPLSGAQPAHPLAYIRGAAAQPRWSPDGKQVAFVSDRGTHALIGIYRLGDESVRYIAPSVFHDTLPRWSRDGSKLAFIRSSSIGGTLLFLKPQPFSIWVWDAANGKTREIWHSRNDFNGSYSDLHSWESNAFQFGAGSRIVFAAQQDGWVHLYSIAADGGSPMLLTPGKFSIQQGSVALTPDGKKALYSSNESDVDRLHLWRVAVDHPGATSLTHGASIEWSPVVTSDGENVLYLSSTATRPGMPYRLTPHGGQMIAASVLPVDYPSAQLVVPKQVVFKSPDGLEIHGQLFMPKEQSKKSSPALIYTHGGPRSHAMLGFDPTAASYMYAENQYLVSRGFVVLSVNYRMGTMYGQAFRQRQHGGPLGASEYQDVVAGAKYLQSLPSVNAQKIGLWGHSYGGYLTALGLARNSDIFKAGVAWAGIYDWATLSGSVKGFTEDMRKVALEASPVGSIERWKSPVLVIQGDDDRNLPFDQTVELVPLLRAHHVPYELIVMPDKTHAPLLWKTWLSAFRAVNDFFERTLVKDEAIPTMPQEQ